MLFESPICMLPIGRPLMNRARVRFWSSWILPCVFAPVVSH